MKAKEYPNEGKSQQADRRQAITFLIILVILFLLIWILGPPPGEGELQLIDGAEDTFKCVYYVDGQPSETPARRVISNNISPYFLDGQVIVSGPIKAINQVRADLEGQIQLEPLELCDVRYKGSRAGAIAPVFAPVATPASSVTGVPPTPSSFRVTPPQAFVLFQVADGDVPGAVQAINAAGSSRGVFADPNYLTGPRAGSPCGSPLEVGGSPLEVGGSPFEVGGSPFEVGGSSMGPFLAEAEANTFWQQPAFTLSNILPGVQLHNERIRVAVFDAIPKKGECDCDCDCNQPFDHLVNIDNKTDVNQDGQLDGQKFQVHIFPTSQANDLQPVDPKSVDVSDHGVFIAGLINAVSGVKEIDLYEVLNGAGCGDLQVLNKALNDYSSTIMAENNGSMKDVVINLSLGVHQPKDPVKENLPEEVFTLGATLSKAHQDGAVIVAAAGNNSADLEGPMPSDLPASYDYVIGVAAVAAIKDKDNNISYQRSCYSNEGDIAALAGDGGPFSVLPPSIQDAVRRAAVPSVSGVTRVENRECLPVSIVCDSATADCAFGVISYSPGSKTRYRFWAGTSFAAPLVSGIAALLLDQGHQPQNIQGVIEGWVVKSPTAPATQPGIIQGVDSLPSPAP